MIKLKKNKIGRNKMDHKKIASELFIEGYNCAQAVFAAFTDVTGLERDYALRLAAGFGGGMGRMREVCGACSGMFMVAGVLFGYTDPKATTEKAGHYALIQELAARFKARMGGTIICRELMENLKNGAPISTDPLHPTPRNEEFYRERPCLRFVECAAEILDELIEERGRTEE